MYKLSPETEARTQASKQKASINFFFILKVSNLGRKTELLNEMKTKRTGTFYEKKSKIYYSLIPLRGYSSVVEHSTADREVLGSNPSVP